MEPHGGWLTERESEAKDHKGQSVAAYVSHSSRTQGSASVPFIDALNMLWCTAQCNRRTEEVLEYVEQCMSISRTSFSELLRGDWNLIVVLDMQVDE